MISRLVVRGVGGDGGHGFTRSHGVTETHGGVAGRLVGAHGAPIAVM